MDIKRVEAEQTRLRKLLKDVVDEQRNNVMDEQERMEWMFTLSERIRALGSYMDGNCEKPLWLA